MISSSACSPARPVSSRRGIIDDVSHSKSTLRPAHFLWHAPPALTVHHPPTHTPTQAASQPANAPLSLHSSNLVSHPVAYLHRRMPNPGKTPTSPHSVTHHHHHLHHLHHHPTLRTHTHTHTSTPISHAVHHAPPSHISLNNTRHHQARAFLAARRPPARAIRPT